MPKCPKCGRNMRSSGDPCPVCTVPGDETVEAYSETVEAGIPVLAPEPRGRPTAPVAQGGAVADLVTVDILPVPEFVTVPAASDPIVRVLVDINAAGPAAFAAGPGPVAHVILLLDVSASMNQPDKYPVLTDALRRMIEAFAAPGSPEVLLSVVLFAHGAKTIFRDVLASTLSAREVLERMDASPLRFTRYTDVAGALKRAGRISIEQLRANRAMPVRTYILTDGRSQDVARTRRIMSRIAELPIDVDALAFGEDPDVAMLQEIVSGGRGGTVKHVRSETLVEALDRIAFSVRRIVSNRAILEFALEPGVVGSLAGRYRPARHSYGADAFAGGTRFRTDLGTIETGRTYSLLFELRLPETDATRTRVGTITLRLRGGRGARVTEATLVVVRAGKSLPEPKVEVLAAADVIAALSGDDVRTQLAALRVRRDLYATERRDPFVRAVIDKAIDSLEREGSLAGLSDAEQATLEAHTCTAGSLDTPGRGRGLGRG